MHTATFLAWLLASVVAGSASAQSAERLVRHQNVIGPLTISSTQALRVCTTDLSRLAARDREARAGASWSSTAVAVLDSRDTENALPLDLPDLVFPAGRGGCAEIAGRDVAAQAAPTSVLVVLSTYSEARARFDPIASGHLTSTVEPQAVGLLIPAIQSARESSSTGSCCACVPVCGCGVCGGD